MLSRFNHTVIILFGWLVLFFSCPSFLWGQPETNGTPPANVIVAKVKTGQVAPQAEFIGTVFYQEVSDVASEMSGLVEIIKFEEGQRVEKGQLLVELGSELLHKRLQATASSYEQVLSELEIARIDLKRRETLFKKKSISEQSYDENRFRVIGLEKRAASLKAQVEQLEIELEKKIIRAPFDGVVINRHVDRGEWLSEGDTVAVIAKDDVVDIVAEVPQRFIQYINIGNQVQITANDQKFFGTVIAFVPKADVATRTIPVKIRTLNNFSLIEGMSAMVTLPTGNSSETLIVPRDAVLSMFGQTVVYAVVDSKANMIPVQIIGYEGLEAGVESQGLKVGVFVVVEGNERLKNGQEVVFPPADVR